MDGNADVARALYELGALTRRAGGRGDRFRGRAYRRAAEAVAAADVDVVTAAPEVLAALPGVGAGIAARIEELRRTGRIAALDRLRATDPTGAADLLRVPGVGPVTAARLRDQIGVTDVEGLRAALAAGRVAEVRGVGPTTVARIAEGLAHLGPDEGPLPLPIGAAAAAAIQVGAGLQRLPGVLDIVWAGDLGRMRDLVPRVDLLVAAEDPTAVLRAAAQEPAVREVAGRGTADDVEHVDLVTFDGPTVRVMAVRPGLAGPAAIRTTAAAAHLAQLDRRAATAREEGTTALPGEGGLIDRAAAAVYRSFGLQPIPAEQRDGTDEVALAAAGRLPRCAAVEDLRGDLHDHTDWSGDGRMTLPELVDGAVARGWQYVAVTDHAEDLTINGLPQAVMARQRQVVARLAAERADEITLLHGAELNIGADGSVDYDPDFLAGFGWTVASVHSHFRMSAQEQTSRLITAIRNPAVRAIGHLTGRRVGRRPGIELDVGAVLDACRETGTALEANCHLDRFDAPAEVLAEAAARGVAVVISTDAHGLRELATNHRWGTALARRGRVPAELVANTWPVDRFLAWSAGAS